MRAGQLRHLLTIQSFTETKDTFGELQKSWSTFATTYGKVDVADGGENFTSAQRMGKTEVNIECRYVPGVLPTMRVSSPDGTLFNILAVMNVGLRGSTLRLKCEQVW